MQGLAEKLISDTPAGVGRPKKNHEQTPARFPAGMLARIDAALREKESRSDFLTEAAERELGRRQNAQGPKVRQ